MLQAFKEGLYGHAIAVTADERETIDVPQIGEEDGEVQQVPRAKLVGIIRPRLEETFELVRARLEASGFDKVAGRRVEPRASDSPSGGSP